ncbi:DNA gyrase inhibitor YacG [uncultured Rhodospira sp.]|uniref:DNA gyrase inhibitor YacG n=1 Tax=uncultured Rhodospira sp. TaxID=1936189 RepID=UPI0026232BF4|nr:DNA gyrase inhibitor YacG [uncultured Rhodospira sp.]
MSESDSQAPDTPVPARLSASACPVCGKATAARYRPFCSRRCADVDLSRWFGGGYVVAGHEPADPEDIAETLAGDHDRQEF